MRLPEEYNLYSYNEKMREMSDLCFHLLCEHISASNIQEALENNKQYLKKISAIIIHLELVAHELLILENK